MNKAEKVMEDFMRKLNNDEFSKDTYPQIDNGFDPTKSNIDQTLKDYEKTLENLKNMM